MYRDQVNADLRVESRNVRDRGAMHDVDVEYRSWFTKDRSRQLSRSMLESYVGCNVAFRSGGDNCCRRKGRDI